MKTIPGPIPFALPMRLKTMSANSAKQVTGWPNASGTAFGAQVIVRNGEVFVWSRGEELVTDRFPEFGDLAGFIPDGTVLDGEILCWRDGRPMEFQSLQTRIGRKTVGKKLLKDAPVILMAYDLMEDAGEDIRELPFEDRRNRLEQIIGNAATPVLRLSPLLSFDDWQELAAEREKSRAHASEGLMLKRKNSVYHTGRRKGDWFKWKVDPMTVDAVMIYAQRGSWPAGQPLHGFHLRGLERRRPRALHQGLFGV